MTRGGAAIDGVLGMGEGILVKVGGEDLDSPILEPAVALLQQQHAEGVGFFAGRTAGTPDAQLAERNFGLRVEYLRNHDLAQRIKFRLIAEETGFANRDFVQQRGKFDLASGLDGETFKVVAKSTRFDLFHPPIATVGEQTKFVIWVEDAGYLIDQVADTD